MIINVKFLGNNEIGKVDMVSSNYQPPNPDNLNAPYTCPRCGGEVALVTTGRSRSKKAINPTTGEATAMLDEDDTAEDITWECESLSCWWWGNADELEDLEEGEWEVTYEKDD